MLRRRLQERAAAKSADQSAPAEEPEAQEPAQAEDPAATAPSMDESMEEQTKLKGLLHSGVLTKAEFDTQKQKILQVM